LSGSSSFQAGPNAFVDNRPRNLGRGLRSGAFVVLFACYAVIVIGLGQRLLLWPAIVLLPRYRTAMVRAWLRFLARATLWMARVVGGIRFSIHGAIPRESCVVVMNHQSVLDIPIGVWLIPGPQTIIPTRDRYRRGIPGISPLARLARFPFVSQGASLGRAELRALLEAVGRVDRGEACLLLYPEGHRTRDGQIGSFMRGGLRIALTRARRPIYCVVADGMTSARTTREALAQVAGSTVTVTIVGPLTPPGDRSPESMDVFIDMLHDTMTNALARMRALGRHPEGHVDASAIAAR
jgi:1-acyl-sn-glycerol-3-phosphate acyltransferase